LPLPERASGSGRRHRRAPQRPARCGVRRGRSGGRAAAGSIEQVLRRRTNAGCAGSPGRTGRRNSSVVEDADRRSAIPRMRSCGRGALCGSNRRGRAPHDAHTVLTEHARQLGASIFWGQPVRGVTKGGLLAGDEEVECRWIVGADGSQSAMRRAAGLESSSVCPRRFGLRRHFRIEP